MLLLKIIVLAIVQGLAELLPVSSSAHVVVAEKLMGLDPSSPPMTLLLVMLHTGTMVAVIAYFWPQWRASYFRSTTAFWAIFWQLAVATLLTALIAQAIVSVSERTVFRDVPHAEIEDLFGHLEFIAPALAAAGVLILIAGILTERRRAPAGADTPSGAGGLTLKRAGLIGAVQGLCLPFRGFSRSGATISTGMLLGVSKAPAEAFSFALAVVLTPPVVARELLRLIKAAHLTGTADLAAATFPSLLGALFAFLAGLLALRWLSRWLENGRWYLFGIYCLAAAVVVGFLHRAGY
jgi:undecaprenyl-diphosphatase